MQRPWVGQMPVTWDIQIIYFINWSVYSNFYLRKTISPHMKNYDNFTCFRSPISRVFIRHRRSENSPPTTQNSPAKFWWPKAQLYISFIHTWNRYVVENYIWRKRYLFFQEDIHRMRWANNYSFRLCASLKVVILLKQACHGHFNVNRRDSTCLNKQWLNI